VTEVYEVGGRRLGVRWNRPGLDAELRALASGAIGVEEGPPNISIVLGERTGRTRSKHQLHVQGRLSNTISSDGGLIRAVIRALGALASGPPPGSLSVDAMLVVDADRVAVAVDRRLARDLRDLEPRLRRGGLRTIELPHLDVWPDRATAVLPDGPAGVGISIKELDSRWPPERGDDDLVAGEVAISRFVYVGRPEPESRGHTVADMVPMLRNSTGRVKRADVVRLVALSAELPLSAVPISGRARLATVLGLS
jgi:hypothetical protein